VGTRHASSTTMPAKSFESVGFPEEDEITSRRAPFRSDFPTSITPAVQTEALREAIRRAEATEYACTTTLVGQTAVIAELRRASGLEGQEVQSAVFTLTRRVPVPPTLPAVSPPTSAVGIVARRVDLPRLAAETEPSPDDTVRIRIASRGWHEQLWAWRYELGSVGIVAFGISMASWLALHR
jgi:hypothetical protein